MAAHRLTRRSEGLLISVCPLDLAASPLLKFRRYECSCSRVPYSCGRSRVLAEHGPAPSNAPRRRARLGRPLLASWMKSRRRLHRPIAA